MSVLLQFLMQRSAACKFCRPQQDDLVTPPPHESVLSLQHLFIGLIFERGRGGAAALVAAAILGAAAAVLSLEASSEMS